jgi:predicted membrane protein
MNDDIRLQALFDSFQPTPTDSDLFTERLERKLALIDEIRQAQAAQIRRYRLAVVAAFVAGIVFGGGVLAFILSTPIDVPLFSFGIKFYPFLCIEQNSRLISVLLTSLMITFCIVAMMNTQDLVRRMKPKNKYI